MSKRIPTDLYSSLRIFRDLSRRELATISSLSTAIPVKAGTELCRQGTPGREAFVVIEGTAAVTVDGAEVATLTAGDVFGELALLDHGPRVATVTAATDMDVLVLTPDEFHRMVEASPAVGLRILADVGPRMREVASVTR